MNAKVILITGGTSGIGEALLQQLSKDNYVVVCGRNQAKLDQAQAKYPETTFVQADISQQADIDRLYQAIEQKHGHLDILINNAGVANPQEIGEAQESMQFLDMDINFKGTVLTINTLLPLLQKSKASKPVIVNVSSILAKIPFYSMPIYSASKAALRSYTISLRNKLPGFLITEVLPPLVDTPMTSSFENASKMSSADVASQIIAGIERNKTEVYPGMARMANVTSKVAFGFISKAFNANP